MDALLHSYSLSEYGVKTATIWCRQRDSLCGDGGSSSFGKRSEGDSESNEGVAFAVFNDLFFKNALLITMTLFIDSESI